MTAEFCHRSPVRDICPEHAPVSCSVSAEPLFTHRPAKGRSAVIIQDNSDSAISRLMQSAESDVSRLPDLRELAAQVIALSDERKLWQTYALSLARDAYRNGYADAVADLTAEDDRAFAGCALFHVKPQPTHAELAALRADHGPACRCADHRSAVA